MHMRGSPATMGSLTDYDDLEGEVHAKLSAAATRARSPVVWIDPGVGFAKTTAQNLRLLGRLDRLVALGWPVLVGASRKRFIGEVLGLPAPADRLIGSLAAVAAAYRAGAQIFRVHDVAATRQLLDMLWAIEAAAGPTEAEAPG
jgi:dihydropteroate synthase